MGMRYGAGYSYLVVKVLMMCLPLSAKVVLGLMSGPIRSGESSMLFKFCFFDISYYF